MKILASFRAHAAEGAVPLRRWLWLSYLRSAIIPLLFIELTFLAIYWISNAIIYRENVAAVRTVSRDYLLDVARREASTIDSQLSDISRLTKVYAEQTRRALDGNYQPPASEKSRYAMSPDGIFYTTRNNGGTASFYSGAVPVGPAEIAKVWKLGALDPLMIDITASNPSVASIYFNTADSYNRIYPYFDVLSQYPKRMAIPTYNFYYEADGVHNPARKAVWTDAYIDPAGHGWMVSSIAPVWRNDKLEGVVGIDVTLKTIVDRLVSLSLPWDGYAILLDREGRIIALPPKGEGDFRLRELTEHHYAEAILADTFKPDSFDINKRPALKKLAAAIRKSPFGSMTVTFDGPHQASFSHIAGPGWTLVVLAPEKNIFANADGLRMKLRTVGLVMLAGLLVFYFVFFVILWRRSLVMSQRVAEPLGEVADLVQRIGSGEHRQSFNGSQVKELDDLGQQLVQTGHQLGEAHDRIVEQERVVSRALAQQKQVNEEQVRFIRIMSHELRTPLSVIDSGAQIIDRKAGELAPEALRERSSRIRAAVRRISDLLHKLVSSTGENQGDLGVPALPVALTALVANTAVNSVPEERLLLDLPPEDSLIADGSSLAIALRAVLDNAIRYSPENSPVQVSLVEAADMARITVVDQGAGISPADLPKVGERFFRGENATGTEGAGVGLHVARRLLEGAGGTLEVESASSGTTVTLTVPMKQRAAGTVAVLEAAP